MLYACLLSKMCHLLLKGKQHKMYFWMEKSKGSLMLNGCIKYLDNTVFIQNIPCQL